MWSGYSMPIEEAELEQQQEEHKPVYWDEKRNRPRMNPRLCFINPEAFFLDLLMEEEEQG